MTPEELQALAVGTAKIAAVTGALGAITVLVLLALLRYFTDWMLEREERAQRIAVARKRGQVQQQVRDSAPDALAGACDRVGDWRTSGT